MPNKDKPFPQELPRDSRIIGESLKPTFLDPPPPKPPPTSDDEESNEKNK